MDSPTTPDQSTHDGSAASLHRRVVQIVEEIESRLSKEHPYEWMEWNSYAGRNVFKMEDPARWRRRVMIEVLKAHLPNEKGQP